MILTDHRDRDVEIVPHLEKGWIQYLVHWHIEDCECLGHMGHHTYPPQTRETFLFAQEICRKLMARSSHKRFRINHHGTPPNRSVVLI